MGKFAAFTLVLLLLISCSSEDDFGLESTQFVFSEQKWELVKMTESWANTETTGSDMAWQEYYIFTPEGTFLKSRTVDEVNTIAEGTFEVMEFEDDDAHYLELTFTTGNGLAANCTGDDKELLMYRTSSMISSLWMACDGPGLDYVLSKN
ncbi:hypothetical protein SAMN04488009_2406 [Maribacter sedimenticola]|uniref:Lipocalin-like domain-containing protein n=1 Tax=Maribacter sedimenticola TaxID=228956 RepID=A0ABY1SHY5_9FLAO|nr:hypothetical protein [Maribacter sedimenticola]SNR55852.1 hypothetical protein SAMN04488009_2406 [Maribacter sedimenticola]